MDKVNLNSTSKVIECSNCGSKGTMFSVSKDSITIIHDITMHKIMIKCQKCANLICLLCCAESGKIAYIDKKNELKSIIYKCPFCRDEIVF